MSQNQRRPNPIKTRNSGIVLLPKGISWPPQAPKSVKEPMFSFQGERLLATKKNKTPQPSGSSAMMDHCCGLRPARTTDLKVSTGPRITKAAKANGLPEWPKAPRAAGTKKRKYPNPRVLQELDVNLVPVPKRGRFSSRNSGI